MDFLHDLGMRDKASRFDSGQIDVIPDIELIAIEPARADQPGHSPAEPS